MSVLVKVPSAQRAVTTEPGELFGIPHVPPSLRNSSSKPIAVAVDAIIIEFRMASKCLHRIHFYVLFP